MEPTTSVFLQQIANRLQRLAQGDFVHASVVVMSVNEIIAQLNAEAHRVANLEMMREVRVPARGAGFGKVGDNPPIIIDHPASGYGCIGKSMTPRVGGGGGPIKAIGDEAIIQQGANRAVNALFAASAIDRAVLDAALTYIEMGTRNAAA